MFLTRQLIIAALALLASAANALDVRGVVGLDAWQSDELRYLPAYRPAHEFDPVTPWAAVTVSHALRLGDETSLTLTAAGDHSAANGSRLTRADADIELGAVGVRVGLLPYRVSWCRQPGDGPWIQEPSATCRYYVLAAMSTGAAGLQVYGTVAPAGWVIDAMAGVYRPMIDGQSWRTFGPLLSGGQEHTEDRRSGLSLNAVHLPSGAQLRASLLQAHEQVANQYSIDTLTAYAAAQMPIGLSVDARVSITNITGATNYGLDVSASDTTAELIWRPAAQHTLAAAWTRYSHTNRGLANTSRGVPAWSLAWRWDVPSAQRIAVIAQMMRGKDNADKGQAFGIRIQKHF